MKEYQKAFIQFALKSQVLTFGNFTLKSGRISPYFYNSGKFKDGASFLELGNFYAAAIHEEFPSGVDVIFGPAYKGIPLATCACLGLQLKFNINMPVSFNRKEVKDHGEGGIIIGESLKDKRVLLVDDVITAGTTIREAVNIINKEGGKLMGIVISLDRQERGMKSHASAIQEVQKEFHLKVASIVTLEHLIEYLTDQKPAKDSETYQHLQNLLAYKAQYGCAIEVQQQV